MQEDSVKSPAF